MHCSIGTNKRNFLPFVQILVKSDTKRRNFINHCSNLHADMLSALIFIPITRNLSSANWKSHRFQRTPNRNVQYVKTRSHIRKRVVGVNGQGRLGACVTRIRCAMVLRLSRVGNRRILRAARTAPERVSPKNRSVPRRKITLRLRYLFHGEQARTTESERDERRKDREETSIYVEQVRREFRVTVAGWRDRKSVV